MVVVRTSPATERNLLVHNSPSTADRGVIVAWTDLWTAIVAATPGSAFGRGGVDHVRISYAASKARLTEALERIEKMLV